MNHELFIAKKIITSRSDSGSINRGTRIILNISILGISLGLAVMLISLSTLTGFQREIRSKVVGFGGHVQISEFNFDNPLQFKPIDKNQPFYPNVNQLKEIRNIQVFALREGIIKTKEEIHGVITKGVSTDFDWQFFKKNIVAGKPLQIDSLEKNKGALISQNIADKLKLDVGDKLLLFFIKDGKTRPRKFTVEGIYNTGLEQFDKSYILVDVKHIQKINGWENNQVSGFEVILHKYEDLFKIESFLYQHIPPELNTVSIINQYPEIFSWLSLQDMNVVVIVVLMLLVCGINMISALLILILEKTNLIGILKSMGAQNKSIRKIFLYMSAYLISLGLFWGNLLGLGLLFLQEKFQLIKLDQSSYYIDHVPVNINIGHLVALNSATLIFCVLFLIIPSYVISNISPVKAIRYN